MNRLSYYIVFLLVLLLPARYFFGQTCEEILQRVGSYHEQNEDAGDQYFKYSTQVTIGEDAGQVLENELWFGESGTLLSNAYMSVWIDGQHRVLLLKQDKRIMLFDAPEGEEERKKLLPFWEFFQKTDTLQKFGLKVSCQEGTGYDELHFIYPSYALPFNGGIKEAMLRYKPGSAEVLSAAYRYKKETGDEIHAWVFLDHRIGKTPGGITTPVINNVMRNGKLLPQYKEYEINDFRNKSRSDEE